jgi:hypothetical protein
MRELNESRHLSVLRERALIDSRWGKKLLLPLSDLLRQSILVCGAQEQNAYHRHLACTPYHHCAQGV